jgi:aspartate kinase
MQLTMRELDMLAATGEQASSALLAIALQAEGHGAVSYAGWQVPIRTDSAYTKARIESHRRPARARRPDAGKVVIVTGFQGIDERATSPRWAAAAPTPRPWPWRPP